MEYYEDYVTNSEGVEIIYTFSGDQATVMGADMSAKRVVIPPTVSYGGKTYNVNYIGENAFCYNSSIQSVFLPPSIQSIGTNAFKGCSNLKKVIVEPNTVPAGFAAAFDVVEDRMTYVGNHNYDDDAPALGGKLNIYEYLSSMFNVEGVTYIPEPSTRTADAIDCDYTTQNISVPTNISYKNATLAARDIKQNAFRGNTEMRQFFAGGGVKTIENGAFDNCTALATVTFERGTTTLLMGQSLTTSPYNLFKQSPVTTVNKGREISYEVSPFANNTNIVTVNASGSAKTIFSDEYTGCTVLTSVTTTDDMSKIEDNAFNGMNLTDITLDGNKLEICNGAFMNCLSLAGVLLEPGVGNIGNQAFRGDNKIRSNLNIASVNELTIGDEAFYDCSAITNLTLGQGVKSIGARAFYNCRLVPRFNLSEKITSIGSGAFTNCETITSIAIPSRVAVVNDDVFNGCVNLANVSIPSSVTTIGARAFAKTTALRTLALPTALTSIGERAFKESGITSATIPDGVTMLPDGCFEETASLETVELNKITAYGFDAFKNSGIKSLNIHDCVTAIADGVFFGCSQLATLNIENATKMLTLGKNTTNQGMFHDCKLENTYIGRPLSHGSVSGEGYSPFYGNTTMQNVTLDGNYTAVAERMFGGCTALDVVTVGNNVLTFNQYSFADCGLRQINIPKKVTYILAHCFENTTRLESIEIPSTVNRIDTYAFNGSGLKSVSISGSVKTITERSFANTMRMESLTLGIGVQTIEQYAFEGSMLPALTIPNTVTSIGNGAFNNCLGLKNFIIADGMDALELGYNSQNKGLFIDCPLENLYIGRTCNYSSSSTYGYSPYYRNTSLKSVEIGDIPTEVKIYMFQDCSALESVTIGDGVTKISDLAFSGCANLATFNVGASVREIGNDAFSDCKLMTTFKTYAANPPVCGSNALSDIDIFSCTLYVPLGAADNYKVADQWKNFFSVEEFDAGITVSFIELSQSTATMKTGETLQLSASVLPEQALNRSVTWTSSNLEVATVDQAGLVTALRDGIVDITVTANDGSGVKAVCKITVTSENENSTYRFVLSNKEVTTGTVARIPVEMLNDGPVLGYQFDLVLPTGMTLAKNAKNKYYIEMSDRDPDHIATIGENNGVYTIVVMEMSNLEITGNDGVICYLPINVTGDPRNATITLRNIHLSKLGDIDEELTPVSAEITVKPTYMKGDANGDKKVTIADVTSTINYIIGKGGSNFVFGAADMDGNGKILISDVTAIVNVLLNASAGASNAPARTFVNGFTNTATMSLAEVSGHLACQFDIELPESSRISAITLDGINSNTHSVVYRQHGNIVRVVILSMENAELCSGNSLNVTIESMTDISGCVLNVAGGLTVEEQGGIMTEHEISFFGLEIGNNATRISEVSAESQDAANCYNIVGQRVKPQTKGVYIVNGKKTIKK